jgi:hypothetical protein
MSSVKMALKERPIDSPMRLTINVRIRRPLEKHTYYIFLLSSGSYTDPHIYQILNKAFLNVLNSILLRIDRVNDVNSQPVELVLSGDSHTYNRD